MPSFSLEPGGKEKSWKVKTELEKKIWCAWGEWTGLTWAKLKMLPRSKSVVECCCNPMLPKDFKGTINSQDHGFSLGMRPAWPVLLQLLNNEATPSMWYPHHGWGAIMFPPVTPQIHCSYGDKPPHLCYKCFVHVQNTPQHITFYQRYWETHSELYNGLKTLPRPYKSHPHSVRFFYIISGSVFIVK